MVVCDGEVGRETQAAMKEKGRRREKRQRRMEGKDGRLEPALGAGGGGTNRQDRLRRVGRAKWMPGGDRKKNK